MASLFGRFGGWLYQQAFLLVCLTYLMWSLNIVLGRHIAGTIPPVTLSALRWGIGALILLPFAWPHLKRDWPAIKSHIPILLSARPDRHHRLRHSLLLGTAIHARDQRPPDPVHHADGDRADVLSAGRRPAEHVAGHRDRRVVLRRAGDPDPRRPGRAALDLVQPRRPLVPGRDPGLRALFAADAQAPGDASDLVPRHHRNRRHADRAAAGGMGIVGRRICRHSTCT